MKDSNELKQRLIGSIKSMSKTVLRGLSVIYICVCRWKRGRRLVWNTVCS